MDQHLDDLQMAALLAGASDAGALRHLASCAACTAERERLAAAIGGWRGALEVESEQPAVFWERQRQAIAARRHAQRSRRSPGLRWALVGAAAALVAIVIGLALRPARPGARGLTAAWIPGAPESTAVDTVAAGPPLVGAPGVPPTTDDALLVAVEGALERRAPEALAPAEALLRELGRSRAEGGES